MSILDRLTVLLEGADDEYEDGDISNSDLSDEDFLSMSGVRRSKKEVLCRKKN